MLCTHFLCRTRLSILKCDELFWDGAGWHCKCEPKKLQCSALEVQWRWLCIRVSGRGGISCTVTLYQRPFVFLPLKEGSWEPHYDSGFMHHNSHMPYQSPTLPSAPPLSTQAAKGDTHMLNKLRRIWLETHFNVFFKPVPLTVKHL